MSRNLLLFLFSVLVAGITNTHAQFYADSLFAFGPCNADTTNPCPSGVRRPGEAVDTDQSNYAEMFTSLGLGQTVFLEFGFSIPAQAGAFVGLTIQEGNQNLNIDLLSSLTIQLLDTGGNVVAEKSNVNLQDIGLLSGTSNLNLLAFFTAPGNYNIERVRIELRSLAGILNNIRVYNAFYLNANQLGVGCGIDFGDTVTAAGPNVPGNVLTGGVTDPDSAADGNINSYATLMLPLIGSAFIEIGWTNPGNPGDFVGFLLSEPNSFLSLGLLNNATITLYDTANTVVHTESSFDLTDVNLLVADTSKRTLGIYAPQGNYIFTKARLQFSGLLTLLKTVRIYEAYKFNPVPAILNVTVTQPFPFCQGATATLAADTGFTNYAWNTGANTPTITTTQPGSFFVTATTPQGCTAVSAVTTIAFDSAAPAPIINIMGDTILCLGEQVTLQSSYPTGNIWSNGFTTQSIVVAAPGTFHVSTVDPNYLCPGLSDTIQVFATSIDTVITGPAGVCPGVPFTLTASGGDDYLWNTGETTASIAPSINTPTTFSVLISDTLGCSATATIMVDVVPLNSVQANNDNGEASFEVPLTIDVTLNDVGNGVVTFVSNPNHGTVGFNDSVIMYTPSPGYLGLDSVFYTFCLPGCDNICDTAWLVISVGVRVPPVITPNGDGNNDIFVIPGIDKYPNSQLQILNRWGDVVYSSAPYQNDWDGTSNTGLSIGSGFLTDGTYFYVLTLTPDLDPMKGFLELRK